MKDFEDSLELFDNSSFSETQSTTDSPLMEMLSSQLHAPLGCPAFHFNSDEMESQEVLTSVVELASSLEKNWQSISTNAAEIAQLLSLFADQAIPWDLVDQIAQQLQRTEQQIDAAKIELHSYQCFSFTDEGFCKLDSLVRPFLQKKLAESPQAAAWKQAFVSSLIASVRRSTQAFLPQNTSAAIPHLVEVATHLAAYLSDEDSYLALTTLGKFYTEQGAYDLAESWYQHCVTTLRSRCPEQSSLVAACLNNLASFYQSQKKYGEAETLFFQALTINQRLENQLELAISLNNLAGLYKTQRKYAEAETLYLQALAIKQTTLGEPHPSLATTLNNLASVYYAQEQYNEAEAIYQRVLELKKCLLGKKHPSLATAWNNLASVYHAQKRYKEAEALYNRAVELSCQTLGTTHPNTMSMQRNIQTVRAAIANNPDEPTPLFQQFVHQLSTNARKLLNLPA